MKRSQGELLSEIDNHPRGRTCQKQGAYSLEISIAEEQLFNEVQENSGVSTQYLAGQFGILSRSTVDQVFLDTFLFPYHVQRVPVLFSNQE